ncbi:MAG: hypothetical protein CL402_09560 [Acidiferrobacteraceae bacterium]|nr:hypothetical protein [Acidiferrobacteraceae bacterium]|tara:strand:+ start:2415 stop:3707 length:1293 start_codon:yes stop_codon:yes gene_type:complete
MKRQSLLLHYFFFLIIILFLEQALFSASSLAKEIDRVYVIVNSDVITQSEIDRELYVAKNQQRSNGELALPVKKLKKMVIENLILKKLQYQKAESIEIDVSENELMSAIIEIATKNNLSMLGLREEIEQTGLSYSEYKQDLHHQLLVQKLVAQEINRHIRISEADIDEYLEKNPNTTGRLEYNLSHILISFEANNERARSLAEELYQRIASGTYFNLVVREIAENRKTNVNSNLGWRNSDQIPDLFLDVVRQMEVGEVSVPIRSKNGFHILRLNGKRGEGVYIIDQNRVRHILLIADQITDESRAAENLMRIRKRIQAGEKFSDIAKRQSADLVSRVLGGDLGWLTPGDLEPELESALLSLSIGEISMPVQTKLGYHLIQLTDRRTHDIGHGLIREKAKLAVRSEKFNKKYREWTTQLISKAWIDYRVIE